MPPVEARQHFDEETNDLLRIDGTRSDVVAGADVETWFRRVRPGGLVLWHGAHDSPALWSLIASRCQSLLFAEGRGGLGVARKEGPPPEAELLRLLFVDGEGTNVDQFYRHMYQHMDFIRILEATGRAM
jgi:hypothetical protein